MLIAPILKNTPRAWKFQIGSAPEFWATMRDQVFLNAVLEGQISIPLKAGIEMDVQLEVDEENQDGVWMAKERSISRVYRPTLSELPLFFGGAN